MAGNINMENKSPSMKRIVILVTGAHIIMILTDGATLSFGIFLTDFANELNVGLGVIGAASSLLTSVLHLFSPVGTLISSKFGYRRTIMIGTVLTASGLMLSSQVTEAWHLFISHSVITGFGISLVYTNTVTFVGMTCDKHMSIANGVTTAGTAVGWISFPIVINVLRGFYGWRGSLLLLGAIGLHATVLSAILFRDEPTQHSISKRKCKYLEDEAFMEVRSDDVEDEKKDEQDIPEVGTKELLKEYLRLPITYPLLGFLMIVANLTFLAFAGTLYHLVSSAIKNGISESRAGLLMTIYGVGNILSRMFHGVPIKLKLIRTNNLFIIALLVAGVSTFVLPFCKTYQLIASATLFIGLSIGTCIPLIYLSSSEIVGVEHFPKAMAMVLFSTGPAGVLAGFFTGWVYDVSGSYDTAFFVMGSFFLIGCFFLVIPRVWWMYKKDSNNTNSNVIDIVLPSPDTVTVL